MYNPNSYFVSLPSEIAPELIKESLSIGICGATSTPMWQMEEIERHIRRIKIEKGLK
jgi:4-hydroxy-3-methylbut-2-enyl diphosphate reductase